MTEWENKTQESIGFILRELSLLREETRATRQELREEIQGLRKLIERELYGTPGCNGIKAQVSKNTEFRENFGRYKLAIFTALFSGLLGLIASLLRNILER
jgi:hypothetical protein